MILDVSCGMHGLEIPRVPRGNFSRTPESFGAPLQLSAKPGILQVGWAHPTQRRDFLLKKCSFTRFLGKKHEK